MYGSHHLPRLALTALAALTLSGVLRAAEPAKTPTPSSDGTPLPTPAEAQKFEVYPAKIDLKGGDDAQQLILTATVAGSRQQDLTLDCKYEPADAKVVRVTSGGRV